MCERTYSYHFNFPILVPSNVLATLKTCTCIVSYNTFMYMYLLNQNFCGSNHSVFKTQNKTVPIRKLENFSQKFFFFFFFFFFFKANLDSASNSVNPTPLPPPPHTHKWEFWFLANLNSASNSANPPPTTNGNFGF